MLERQSTSGRARAGGFIPTRWQVLRRQSIIIYCSRRANEFLLFFCLKKCLYLYCIDCFLEANCRSYGLCSERKSYEEGIDLSLPFFVYTYVPFAAQRATAFVLFLVEREYSRKAKANANRPKPNTINVIESNMLTHFFHQFCRTGHSRAFKLLAAVEGVWSCESRN